jgi:hypothetical protein
MSQGGSGISRLLSRLQNLPWSLGIAIGMLIFFLPHPDWHGDLFYFRTAPESMRHPLWARWIFAVLGWLPEPAAYLLLSTACIALLYFAVRQYGGKHWIVFTSFAFAWTLYYGQIDGLVIGGLAIAWWAIQKQHPYLVGAGLILASIKPQLSVFLLIAIWWWSPSRWKALVIPLVIAGLSFLAWGWWLPGWFKALAQTDDLLMLSRNISLWTIFGWWIWLIWPLVAVLSLERWRKLIAIAAATAITVPYFPLPSSVLFLVMPIPVFFYAAQQALVVTNLLGVDAYAVMKIIPPALLVWAAWPAILRVKTFFGSPQP